MKTLILSALAALLSFSAVRAQQISATGDQYTLVSQGARESAMGGNFSAFADGAFSVFGNPAASAAIKGGDLSLSQIFWFANTNEETAAFSQSVNGVGTLGAGFSVYWVPSFDNTGGAEAAFSSTSYQGLVSYATPLNFVVPGLALGISGRYLYDNMGGTTRSDEAANAGLYYQTPWKPLSLGFTLKDMELQAQNFYTLPFSYSYGLALKGEGWMFAGEILQVQGQDSQFQLGGEIEAAHFLSFRAGFRSEDTDGSYFGPSAGVGVKLDDTFRFDYAVANYGDLGLVHWIALGIGWDNHEAPKPTSVPTAMPTPAATALPTTVTTPVATPVATPKDNFETMSAPVRHVSIPRPTPQIMADPGFPLRGQVVANNAVQLDWDNQSGAAGYNIYVSLVPAAGFKKINDQPVSTLKWSELTGLHGITFYYKAAAVDTNGDETQFSEVRPVAVP